MLPQPIKPKSSLQYIPRQNKQIFKNETAVSYHLTPLSRTYKIQSTNNKLPPGKAGYQTGQIFEGDFKWEPTT